MTNETIITHADVEAFKLTVQNATTKAEGFDRIAPDRQAQALACARIAAGYGQEVAAAVMENDFNKFNGCVYNMVSMMDQATMISLGVSEAEMRRRLRLAREIIFYGKGRR